MRYVADLIIWSAMMAVFGLFAVVGSLFVFGEWPAMNPWHWSWVARGVWYCWGVYVAVLVIDRRTTAD